jgi:hypothetical protein
MLILALQSRGRTVTPVARNSKPGEPLALSILGRALHGCGRCMASPGRGARCPSYAWHRIDSVELTVDEGDVTQSGQALIQLDDCLSRDLGGIPPLKCHPGGRSES